MFKTFFVTTFILFLLIQTSAQTQTLQRNIAPDETDQAIDEWTNEHVVCFNPSVEMKNQLFVFLPGSHLDSDDYELITHTAADAGLHAVSLTYPNSWTVNWTLCDGDGHGDPNCHENVRLEIIDGTDRTPLVEISRANSIENRLIKLIAFLDQNHPDENWGQYLDADNNLVWSSIIFAGHSQGAAHSAVLAKYHRLARIIMIAGGTDGNRTIGLAPWIGPDNATPSQNYYGFTHSNDNLLSKTTLWGIFGMTAYGELVDVDTTPPPYEYSHTLVTSRDVRDAHQSVVVDGKTPTNGEGKAVYGEVWRYMMVSSSPVTTVKDEPATLPQSIQLHPNYPNPFSAGKTFGTPLTRIGFVLPQPEHVTLTIYDTLGREIATLMNQSLPAGEHSVWFNGKGLPSGTYIYRLMTKTRYLQRTMQLVK